MTSHSHPPLHPLISPNLALLVLKNQSPLTLLNRNALPLQENLVSPGNLHTYALLTLRNQNLLILLNLNTLPLLENLVFPGNFYIYALLTLKKTEPSNTPELQCSPTSTTKHSTEDLSPTTAAQQEFSPSPAEQLPQHISPSATYQPQPLPLFSPHYPPLEPHSPFWYFRDYLVKFYSRPKDPVATWPPLPSKIFINLAVINREKISTKELHKFILATLDKGVDTILETKAPVEVEQLLDTKPGIKQQCVLVEGAPGVGNYSPLHDFTALGYCIANSSYKWKLKLGNNTEYMQSTSGVDLLVQALHYHISSSYSIYEIQCWHKETVFAQHLLAGLPHHTLPLIKILHLYSEGLQPLPTCLPELVCEMNILRDLKLWRATADTLANMLQALATAPPYTLMWLSIKYTPFNPQVMQALCALLGHSKLVAELVLHNCGLTDDLACLLSTALGKLPELRIVNLSDNTIGDEGAVAIAGALNMLRELRTVDLQYNTIGRRGCVAFEECEKTNERVRLYF